MFDEPPMPSTATEIDGWLKHPAVIARIQRGRVNSHGKHWEAMAAEASERDRVRPRPTTNYRRLRSIRAYLKMRGGLELTALDRQALSQVAGAAIKLIAYANVLNPKSTFELIGEINQALSGGPQRQQRLVETLEDEADLVLLGQPTADPAATFIPNEKEERQDDSHLEATHETSRHNGNS